VKAVILAGGLGTRLREETEIRPKPLIEIGGRPILWHILKIYSHHGVNDFVICLGYKGYMIKEYFANYALHMSNVTFDMTTGERSVHRNNAEPWRVTLVDTGDETMTGGRLLRARRFVEDDHFCLTYGDGVGDVDITALLAFHREHGKDATLTAVQPPARFGALEIGAKDSVTRFEEKPIGEGSRINGGFFVLSPKVFQTIEDDDTVWERGPLEQLSASDQLKAYRHDGFWHPMDTLRDKLFLESLWSSPNCPWKVWR
jgi:glucose-1-phosphate cytidylyltransferase